MNETFTVCPTCRQRIEPGEPGSVYAREQVPVPGFGSGNDVADGIGAWFHAGHYPAGTRYRTASHDESDAAARSWHETH